MTQVVTLHTTGGQSALHAEQDGGQGEAQRPVVLQEGAVHEQVWGQPCAHFGCVVCMLPGLSAVTSSQ